MQWKSEVPPPAKEEHIGTGQLFKIHLWRNRPSDSFTGFGDCTKYGVIGDFETHEIGEAQSKALRNYRDHIAKVLAEVDAAIADECLAEAGIGTAESAA